MKRFITISLLAAIAAPALACMWIETHNYYLFSVYDSQEFKSRVDQISIDNWKAYLGLPADEYFYFDAERVAEAAQQKGDALMASYATQLNSYLECVRLKERMQYEWDYPTPEEMSEGDRKLVAVRTYAQGKLTSRLRSQHALLYMRCNMLMGRHGENVNFWEQTASKYIESVYKDMMENIYAGALLKTGHADRAGQLFAKQGDWQSLMTQYYKKRSFQAIRQEYLRDPQSAVLPFLLQDFVNNAQEATDVDNPLSGGLDGKLFIRNIQRAEAMQMIQLATQAANEGKTQYPALWMSAKAWLEFMYGNRSEALTDIKLAQRLDGTERMKENARVLLFYITAMQSSVSTQFDDYVATEMQWLTSLKEKDDHYDGALDRIVHQAIHPLYDKAGRKNVALALLNAVHNGQYGDLLDTMPTDDLLSYIDYVKSPASTALDRLLKPQIKLDDVEMTDLLGTKHLRLCQWQEAIKYLQKVPLSYYNDKGYAPYAIYRSYTVEPWRTRQWLKDDQFNDGRQLTENPKVVFAREMMKLEKDLNRLSGQKRQQCCYDLAVRYAQASFNGDCWFLMRDGKSAYDEVRDNEVDLNAKARLLLSEASQTSNNELKEKALFALAYFYLNDKPWYEEVWNDQSNSLVKKPIRDSQQYKAWAALFQFEQNNPNRTSDYVSGCDEYKQFRKFYRP